MNSKSGQDSQRKTEESVPSPEQPSNGSLEKSDISAETTLSSLSPPRLGDPRLTKKEAVSSLVKVAEGGDRKISAEGKQFLNDFINTASRGFVGSMAMTCKGVACPFLSACPLNKIGAQLPVNSPCPVEYAMVSTWVTKHLDALGIKDVDDPAHSFDMDMLYELAGQELIRWRCSVHLANDPRLVSNQQVSATTQGEPIFADVINPVLDVMERSGRNIAKIRDALVATREAQVKAGQNAADPSTRAADLRVRGIQIAEANRKKLEIIREQEK